ncbi:hypothetical protein [Sphingobacterium mizutaii]|uniref:hypothetical protein n=1 Tax=Sphingobacterium mizutaii TaxID=1010 RepID=UPI002899ADEE|nr:hypothetical protein [Sphingobacterium mizutaii]
MKKKRTKHDPNRIVIKKTIDLYEDQLEVLEEEAANKSIAVQALIRNIIDKEYNLSK